MPANIVVLSIVIIYIVGTTFIGLWQSRKVKQAKDFGSTKLSVWQAGTFLAGLTLGGGATYGIAGDSVKYGFTYLVFFPMALLLGWWLTGIIFARRYYRSKGSTVPAILEDRFGKNTHLVSSISTMIYSVFIMVLELYALALIVRAIFPQMPMGYAALISLAVCVLSVSFSGILGASLTNQIHNVAIVFSLALSLFLLWRTVGGFSHAIALLTPNLLTISGPSMTPAIWSSATGLGLGVVGQLLMGKMSRLGGISVVSNVAASCKSEKHAMAAFGIAGISSGIPPIMAGMVGIFSAALIGPSIASLPSYSYIGLALVQISPVLAGILLAAFAAAILSAFGPGAIVMSNVLVDEIMVRAFSLSDQQKRKLYTLSIIVVSIFSAVYVAFGQMTDILPFLYLTAFPCTAPITVVILFGLFNKNTPGNYAFWSIVLGVSTALVWGLALGNPFKIPNIYLSFFIPLVIMSIGAIKYREKQGNLLVHKVV